MTLAARWTEWVARTVRFRSTLLVGVTAVALYAVRLLGPNDLVDYGQEWPLSYVLDAVEHGHWVVQTDVRGQLASKPPLYVWLAALVSKLAGEVNRFTLTLPAFVATAALALLIHRWGRAQLGDRAGLLAAMMYLLSPVAVKQIALVRTDGVFALAVAVGAWLAFRAWETGGSWTPFWLAGAAATLTKGPLGLVFSAIGLMAIAREPRPPHRAILRAHAPGVLLFLLIVGGWFLLAWRQAGSALADRMLISELYGHAVGRDSGSRIGAGFYLPLLYFLSRFAPWSALALWGCWCAWRRPASEPSERRAERFLGGWLLGGLLLLSLGAHQRPDLMFPLVPAGALLAGRVAAVWLEGWSERRLQLCAAGAAAATVLVLVAFWWPIRSQNEAVAQTRAAEALAREIRTRLGNGSPITHVDTSPVVQMHLGTAHPLVSWDRARRLLRGEAAAFVAVKDADAALARIGTNGIWVVAEAPRTRRSRMAVLGNRPQLAPERTMATWLGPVRLEWRDVERAEFGHNRLRVRANSENAQLTFQNGSCQPTRIEVCFEVLGVVRSATVELSPGGARTIRPDAVADPAHRP